ncbi:hypothetical protein OQA88_9002 [Cercophora sp. LCS_1]
MSAGIVYEGANGGTEARGTLFEGINFWVHQRVPARPDLLERIKKNGGQVKPLEKHAQIIIADHVRKDAPPGSVSWKFIDESIKRGKLCNKDDYIINGQTPASRNVGSTQHTKATRNHFTLQEDGDFARWVLEQERLGRKIGGNTIYQEYAEEHPTHTWQSWRDRWAKTLSLQNRPEPTRPEPASPPRASEPVQRRGPQRIGSLAKASKAADGGRVIKPRVRFTDEDDKILRDWVNTYGTDRASGNKIYQDLEQEHPHHSAHSWRDRWVKYLSKAEDSTDSDDPEPSQSPKRQPPPSSKPPQQSPKTPRLTTTAPHTSPKARQSSPKAPPRSASIQKPTPKGIRQVTTATDMVGKDQVLPGSSAQQQPRATPASRLSPKGDTLGGSPRRSQAIPTGGWAELERRCFNGRRLDPDARLTLLKSVKRLQRVVRGWLVRRALADSITFIAEHLIPRAKGMMVRNVYDQLLRARLIKDIKQKNFHQYLQDFQTFKQLPHTLKITISGKSVALWDLWEAATEDEVAPDYRDWEEICKHLEIDPAQHPGAPNELKAAYAEHLGTVEDWIAEYERQNFVPEYEDEGTSAGNIDGEVQVKAEDDEMEAGHKNAGDEATDHSHPEAEGPEAEEPDVEMDTQERDALGEVGLGEVQDEVLDKAPGDDDAASTPRQPLGVLRKVDDFASSPPIAGLKRSFAQSSFCSPGDAPSSNKRRRFQRGEEVPCTPDRDHSRQRSAPRVVDSSPAVAETSQQQPYPLPLSSAKETKIPEPQTQDFEFQLDHEHDIISPSQQLRSEDRNRRLLSMPDVLPSIETPFPTIEACIEADVESVVSDTTDELPSVSKLHLSKKPQLSKFAAPVPEQHGSDDSDAFASPVPPLRTNRPQNNAETVSAAAIPKPASKGPSLLRRKKRDSSGSQLPTASRPQVPPSTALPASSTLSINNTSYPTGPPAVPSGDLKGVSSRLIRDWRDYWQSLGYSGDIVWKALMATNFYVKDAPHVMQCLKDGEEIPRTRRGIWTEDDDAQVTELQQARMAGKDHLPHIRKMERDLVNKHGIEGLQRRLDFVNQKSSSQVPATPTSSVRASRRSGVRG